MAVVWKKIAYSDDVINNTLLSAKGDIIYASGANVPARLAIGTDDYILRVATDVPNWEALPAAAAHKDTHDPNDGTDKLDTAAAAEISAVVAAGAGTSHSFAAADHVHAISHAITDNHLVTIDGADIAATEIAMFTANGLLSKTPAEIGALIALDDIGDPDAAVDFNDQQALDIVLPVSADVPATPILGKIYFDTDLSAYICTSIV
jgi:hypothetical protein